MIIGSVQKPKTLSKGRAKARGWGSEESSLSDRLQGAILQEGAGAAKGRHP